MQASFANLQVFSAALARLIRQGKADAQLQERLKAAAEALAQSFRELGQVLTNPAQDFATLDAFLVKAMAANFEGRLQGIISAVRNVRAPRFLGRMCCSTRCAWRSHHRRCTHGPLP